MAQTYMKMALALAFVAMQWCRSLAQPNCMPAMTSLSSCMGFMTGRSSSPPPMCCSNLASVVQMQAQCLCSVLTVTGAAQLGFVVNQTQALTLPGVCRVTVLPLSQCNRTSQGAQAPTSAAIPLAPSASAGPSASPTSEAPADAKPSTPTVTSGPASTASKTVPKTGVATSAAGISTKLTTSPLFCLLFVASLA